ncbi:MAG: S49 family peptidase, partial [Nocardioidaceae bacterium]
FTAKAAHDRGMAVDELREVAKGRVWTGADAHGHRLVDHLGGLDDAVDIACERARVRREDVDLRALPKSPLLRALRPAQSSESPAAAATGPAGGTLLDHALHALGVPAYGVLTAPVLWDLR